MRLIILIIVVNSILLLSSPVPHLSEKHELCRTDDGPVEVMVSLQIISIPYINEPEEKFHIHGILKLEWNDPYSKFHPDDTECDPVIFEEEATEEALSMIWWPDPDFHNEISQPKIDNQILTIYSNGDSELEMMIEIELKYVPDLHQFPFDKQNFSVIIEPFGFTDEEVLFKIDSSNSGYEKGFMPLDWNIYDYSFSESIAKSINNKDNISRIQFEIISKRDGKFYIWRLLLPMILIVMVTWTVFWMVGEKLNDRIKVIAIGMLSAISFAHIIADEIPDIPYLTFLDAIFIGSFVIVFLSVIESLISYNYAKKDMIQKAHKIDFAFRIIMPIVYVIMFLSVYYSFF